MSIQKLNAHPRLNFNETKIIWHRCNSAAKIITAINAEKHGVAGIEFDIVATSDNIPVLFHDRIITKELIGGEFSYLIRPIEVSQLSFAELRRMRPDIDSLREVLEAIKNKNFSPNFEFHLEIKPGSIELTDKIMWLLKQFPHIDRQTIPRSFQPGVLVHIKKHYRRDICLLLGYIFSINPAANFENRRTAFKKLPENVAKLEDICGGFRPEYVSVYYKMLTQGFIDAMKAVKIELDIYTLNNIADLGNLKVDRIITDYPKEISSK